MRRFQLRMRRHKKAEVDSGKARLARNASVPAPSHFRARAARSFAVTLSLLAHALLVSGNAAAALAQSGHHIFLTADLVGDIGPDVRDLD